MEETKGIREIFKVCFLVEILSITNELYLTELFMSFFDEIGRKTTEKCYLFCVMKEYFNYVGESDSPPPSILRFFFHSITFLAKSNSKHSQIKSEKFARKINQKFSTVNLFILEIKLFF